MVVPATTNDSAAAFPTTTHMVQFIPAAQLPIKLQGNLNFATGDATQQTRSLGISLVPNLLRQPLSPKLIAMMASIDPTIAPIVATASSAKMAWYLLHIAYTNNSHTRIFSLRD
ncbi:hypothetical protein KY289_008079 [Solanum tuberosum]|nr:hypothetical protein KY289_008079 [Solanum tuberosum]